MVEITCLASSSQANAYHITDGRTPLLIECGVRYRTLQRDLKFQVSSLAGCLITHEHRDHSLSVENILKTGVNVYTSNGTARALELKGHRIHRVTAQQVFNIGTWKIMAFDTVHDAKEPFGFLLASGEEKVCFATDTAYLKYRFVGVTHLMIECNYCPDLLKYNVEYGIVSRAQQYRLLRSHASIDTVAEMLQANDLTQLQGTWLLHLSRDNADPDEMRRVVQSITGRPVYIAKP